MISGADEIAQLARDFNAMAESLAAVPAELARRAAPGAAGLAGGDRQPPRPGGRLRRERRGAQRERGGDRARAAPRPRRRRPARERAARGAGADRAGADPRALGEGAVRAPRLRGGAPRRAARRRAVVPAPRHARWSERTGRSRGDGDPPGRHPAAAVRRAEERPRRHRRARVPHAAHLALDGDPPLPRGAGRPGHREAGGPALRRARRTAPGSRASSTTCSTSPGSQAGPARVELAPHSAPLLVEAAVAEHQGEAEAANVRLVAEPIEPVEVLADRERVALVFSNLIRNALRHARVAGAVVVRGRAEGPAFRFEVQDDGAGIAPEHQPRVFDRFFQVPGGDQSGAGLGLSIAKEIVLAHERRDRRREPARRGEHVLVHAPARGVGSRRCPSAPPRLRAERAPSVLLSPPLPVERRGVDPEHPRRLLERRGAREHRVDVGLLERLERELAADPGAGLEVRARDLSGSASGSITFAGQTITARSIALRSSRTLPGQAVGRGASARRPRESSGALAARCGRRTRGTGARAGGCRRGARAAAAPAPRPRSAGRADPRGTGRTSRRPRGRGSWPRRSGRRRGGCGSRRAARTASPGGSGAASPAAAARARRSRRGRACRPRRPRPCPA